MSHLPAHPTGVPTGLSDAPAAQEGCFVFSPIAVEVRTKEKREYQCQHRGQRPAAPDLAFLLGCRE